MFKPFIEKIIPTTKINFQKEDSEQSLMEDSGAPDSLAEYRPPITPDCPVDRAKAEPDSHQNASVGQQSSHR